MKNTVVYTNAKDAKTFGSKKYFTGVPCVNGHTDFRLVSSRECCSCAAARKKKNVAQEVKTVVKTIRKVVFHNSGYSRYGYMKFACVITRDERIAVTM
jgi:hypothetical protein